ncbi:MAG: twin-arginine translocase TatA/TatE family subunit [Candidatus Latescibacteria bacterium]|jgi:sec-independent protein translocase protein TatA|nr:twin-arginine translocase TatA/TatE family subunit [Candidatus Latescibacterota bacterium]
MLESVLVQRAFIGGLGPMELTVIFLIVLLVFGAKRIPEIAKGLGKGITEFKKAAREITDELDVENNSPKTHVKNELKEQPAPAKPQQSSTQEKKSDSVQG